MSDSAAPFAELKEGDSSSSKKEASVPINVLASTKPLPTTVKKPAGDTSSADYSSLFLPTTAAPYTADWFFHYLKQTRVLVILALATFLLILVIWAASIGHPPPYSATVTADCSEWTRSEIIPDVISVCPQGTAEVYYPSMTGVVNMGGQISAESATQKPSAIFVPGAVASGYYTAVFLHPDTPTANNPTGRSALKGIVTNLRLHQSADPNKGEWIFEYDPPTPNAGTGAHRYVWLVYRHSYAVSGLVLPTSRLNFNVEKWMAEAWPSMPQLVGVNYFTSRPTN